MFRHYITKYSEGDVRYVESWIQINIFGKCICLSKKRIKIWHAKKGVRGWNQNGIRIAEKEKSLSEAR